MDIFWEETPFGNSYAMDFVEELKRNGVSSLEELYTDFSETTSADIELESKIYAAASIIKYVLREDNDEVILHTIGNILRKDESFQAEDFVEDTLIHLQAIKADSALASHWNTEGIYNPWSDEVQEIINGISKWISEAGDSDKGIDDQDFDGESNYDFEDDDY